MEVVTWSACPVSPESLTPFLCSFSSPTPPSLKPRMQCLFKNALADEIFHCLACWRRGCQERASRHTKYFASHANSSLITNSNQCFLARFPVLQVFQVERKGEISVIIYQCYKCMISLNISRIFDSSLSFGCCMYEWDVSEELLILILIQHKKPHDFKINLTYFFFFSLRLHAQGNNKVSSLSSCSSSVSSVPTPLLHVPLVRVFCALKWLSVTSTQMIEGVQMSEKTELGLPSWRFIFDLSKRKYYVLQGWLLDSSERLFL